MAYTDLPRNHQKDKSLDLFCISLNYAYLQRHLLAIKLHNLTKAVEAGRDNPQNSLCATFRTNFWQEKEETTLDLVKITHAKLLEMEVSLQVLQRLTSEIKRYQKTQRATTKKWVF